MVGIGDEASSRAEVVSDFLSAVGDDGFNVMISRIRRRRRWGVGEERLVAAMALEEGGGRRRDGGVGFSEEEEVLARRRAISFLPDAIPNAINLPTMPV